MAGRSAVLAAVLLEVALGVVCASAATEAPKGAAAQLAFGTQMAQRGLWNEALFRYREAEKLEPQNARVLNNLAVACEGVGKFDEALKTYQRALKIDPANSQLKTNYARFIEFYQGFKPRAAEAKPAASPAPGASPSPSPSPVPTAKPPV